MKFIKGDLIQLALDGHFDVIVHGCNCFCTMSGGIALSIQERFPESYSADCTTEKGSRAKLGSISTAVVVRNGVRFTVVNAYTQYNWYGSGVLADYDAIRHCF